VTTVIVSMRFSLPVPWRPLATLLTAATVTGCATYNVRFPRVESHAIEQDSSTKLGGLYKSSLAEHSGLSGVEYVRRGRVSLEARLALCELAERTLDLQYYIWDADISGRFLADRLIDAAERGVRVRVLLDDHSVVGRDHNLAQISGHPNIEVRAFNPFRDRRRVGDLFTDPSRVNRRSHNKIFVADNEAAIVGGRNIADHYFGVHDESNYRDLDIFAVGPVVRDISRVFDTFWNSKFAIPYAAFVDHEPTTADAEAAMERIRDALAEDPMPYDFDREVPALVATLARYGEGFTWAPVQVLHDDPAKAEDKDIRGIVGELKSLAENAEREILIENAYFVPRKPMIDLVKTLTARGVTVRVLTNSMASNDVAAVYSGYERYRDDLLRAGADIYELRPDSAMLARWSMLSAKSRSGLHTKTMVVDREHTVIGSYNLDPRSADINSELALLVDSPEFGARVAEYLDEGVLPENSYRVTLEDGDLVWTTVKDGETVRYRTEPHTTWWQRFQVGLIGILPIHSQL